MQQDPSREHVRFWCVGTALQQAAQDAVIINEHKARSVADDVLERRDEEEDSQYQLPLAFSTTPRHGSSPLASVLAHTVSLVVWPTAKRIDGLSSRNLVHHEAALSRAGDMSKPRNGALAWAKKGFTKALPLSSNVVTKRRTASISRKLICESCLCRSWSRTAGGASRYV